MRIRWFPVVVIGVVLVAAACGGEGLSKVPLVHRVAPPSCTSPPPAGNCGQRPNDKHLASPGQCARDSECTSGGNGRCTGPSFGMCFCTYDACNADADCQSGHVCDCRELRLYAPGAANVCLASGCRVDTDCGASGYCSPSHDIACGLDGEAGWFCHTPQDRCTNDSDCPIGNASEQVFCGFDPALRYWRCAHTTCVN